MEKLERDFYLQDAVTVARGLLGKFLVHESGGSELVGRIVETEAYTGPEDKACHAYGMKRTKRNEVMYSIGGTSYVYFIYGMYYCFNVVTEEPHRPSAVLVRAVEPVGGMDEMAQNRYGTAYSGLTDSRKYGITNGPGKLCMAMAIHKAQNGLDLCGSELYIGSGAEQAFNVVSTPRINIDYAEEYAQMPLRFYIEGSRYVSVK